MARQQGNAPTRKVGAAALGAAVTTIAVFFLNKYLSTENGDGTIELFIPDTIQGAITTVVVFGLGYVIRPAARDQVST